MTNRDKMHLKSNLLIENALMSQKSYLLIIIDCSRSININNILRVIPRNSPKSNLEFQLHKHTQPPSFGFLYVNPITIRYLQYHLCSTDSLFCILH